MDILKKRKQVMENSSDIMPWDLSFYIGLVKATECFVNSNVSQFFGGFFLSFFFFNQIFTVYNQLW